jgi:hypothetical protein
MLLLNGKLILLAAGVEFKELDAAIKWAFGSIEVPVNSWAETWNHKHKHIFEMKGDLPFFDTVYLVGEAYVKHECGVWRSSNNPRPDAANLELSEESAEVLFEKKEPLPIVGYDKDLLSRDVPKFAVTPQEFKVAVDSTIEQLSESIQNAYEEYCHKNQDSEKILSYLEFINKITIEASQDEN